MNVNPISFGKTIKVNSSIASSCRAAGVINGHACTPNEENMQIMLRGIMPDYQEGQAQAFSFEDETSYILTGKESVEATKLLDSLLEKIGVAKKQDSYKGYYEDILRCESAKYLDSMKHLILRTVDYDKELDLGFDTTTRELTTIDIIG